MIFTDLPAGASVFLDANVLLNHFTAHPQFGAACTDLLERISRLEFTGYTSTHMLSEVAHRMMTIEASQRFGWPFAGIVYRLRQHPDKVKQLAEFRKAIQEVPQFGIHVLTIPPDLIDAAAEISQQTGLLSNDALVAAVMKNNALTNLASNDGDFDRVPGLTRYAPV